MTLALIATFVVVAAGVALGAGPPVYRVDHVVDGDTIVLRNGQRVRLVQIDAPEVYFGTECYGRQASQTTKRLLPAGSVREPTVERRGVNLTDVLALAVAVGMDVDALVAAAKARAPAVESS